MRTQQDEDAARKLRFYYEPTSDAWLRHYYHNGHDAEWTICLAVFYEFDRYVLMVENFEGYSATIHKSDDLEVLLGIVRDFVPNNLDHRHWLWRRALRNTDLDYHLPEPFKWSHQR